MNLYNENRLNTQAFDVKLRTGLRDFASVLMAAVETHAQSVESTHFLMAMGAIADGALSADLGDMGIGPEQWRSGLADCVIKAEGGPPLSQLARESLHETAHDMLVEAKVRCDSDGAQRISEDILLYAALGHLTPKVRELCESANVDVEEWRAKVAQRLEPLEEIDVFGEGDSEPVNEDAFAPSGRKILALLRTETESFGYEMCDARHLLLALLENEGGAAHYGLYCLGHAPRKVQEAVTLSLRGRPSRKGGTAPLDMAHLQPIVRYILEAAAQTAARARRSAVSEPDLLCGLLEVENSGRRILEECKVDVPALLNIAKRHEVEEVEEPSAMADIETVKERLMQRVVGQDDAIERILPYVQRMRFGFASPNRPLGVFLFCGQSGSGKTEMAKALAHAVYGSEDALVFIEMGHLNSRESINVFVGAPPGYVGYGEGKLTNGLRDKPRSVVLLDEVEKAHPKVLDALLRFLDEGKIDDPAGPVRDGTQCIVILTSNVGAEELSKLATEMAGDPKQRGTVRQKLREEFKRHEFRVEFLNRVDELILFRTLELEDYAEISRRVLASYLRRLRDEHGIDVAVGDSVAEQIGRYCASISEGARATHRLVNSVVVTPAINYVLQNACPEPVRLCVEAVPGEEGCEPEGRVALA